MKKLFDRLFKKETEFSYVIAEYQPIKIDRSRHELNFNALEMDKPSDAEVAQADEMQIDKIYQRN